MVISQEHKYLFIEVPQTGCTAIARELCQHYSGRKILWKHATYVDFLKQAAPEERRYFVFAGIRQPMDVTVSVYFKLKLNHGNKFTDPQQTSSGGYQAYKHHYDFIQRTNADFLTYFREYYTAVYNQYYLLRHRD